MAFGQTTLIAALVANGFLGVLFVYLVYEGFQLSKADDSFTAHKRKPWVDKLMALTQVVLCLALVGVAVAMGNGYFFGF